MIRKRLRLAAAAVLFASLSLRAIIPLGYMPGDLLAGEFMVLCPTGSAATIAGLKHHDHGADGTASVEADVSCPIGSVLLAAALPAPAPPSLDASAAPLPVADRPATRFIRSHVRRYHSRAPPQA